MVINRPGNYPKDFIKLLKAAESMDDFKGKEQNVILLLVDLRNFTMVVEREQYSGFETIRAFLNIFYDEASRIIQNNEGATVNKLLGDGMLCYFPEALYINAIESAFDIKAKFDSLYNRYPLFQLGLSIVLHFGKVTFSKLGGTDYVDYAIISRHVNRAFRLLRSAKGKTILINTDLYYKVKEKYSFVGILPRIYDGIGFKLDAYWLLSRETKFQVDCSDCQLYQWCYEMFCEGTDARDVYDKAQFDDKKKLKVGIFCDECYKKRQDRCKCIEYKNSKEGCDISKAKLEFNESRECCHVCDSFYICAKNYWIGFTRPRIKMIPCAKTKKMIDVLVAKLV